MTRKRIWKQRLSALLSLSMLVGQTGNVYAVSESEHIHDHEHEELVLEQEEHNHDHTAVDVPSEDPPQENQETAEKDTGIEQPAEETSENPEGLQQKDLHEAGQTAESGSSVSENAESASLPEQEDHKDFVQSGELNAEQDADKKEEPSNPEIEEEKNEDIDEEEIDEFEPVYLEKTVEYRNPLFYPDGGYIAGESKESPYVHSQQTPSIGLFSAARASNVYETDLNLVAEDIREHLRVRDTEFTVKVAFDPADYSDDIEKAFDAFYETNFGLMMEEAYRHTSQGDEGDYIRLHLNGYTVKISLSYSSGLAKVDFKFTPTYHASAEDEAIVNAELQKVYAGFTPNASTATTVKEIYSWITSNVDYLPGKIPETADHCFSAYGALIDHVCVCQGYSLLLYRMLLDHGIDSRIITGWGNNEAHGWNIVKMEDDLYYLLDSTWDANLSESQWNYYMKPADDFDDHHADDDYTTPEFQKSYPICPTLAVTEEWNPQFGWTQDQRNVRVFLTNPLTGITYERTASLEKLTDKGTPATCNTGGEEVFKASVTFNSFTASKEMSRTVSPTGHSYSRSLLFKLGPTIETTTATATLKCTKCDFTKSEDGEVTFDSWRKEPTCEISGTAIIKTEITVTGEEGTEIVVSDTNPLSVPAYGHQYSQEFEVVWSSDHSLATLNRTCQRCGKVDPLDAKMVDRGIVELPTCSQDGYSEIAALHPVTREVVATHRTPIPANGQHSYDLSNLSITWAEDNSASVSYQCRLCGDKKTDEAEISEQIRPATCTEDGLKTLTATCRILGSNGDVLATVSDTKEVAIPKNGHQLSQNPTFNWADDLSSASAVIKCENCSYEEEVPVKVTFRETTPATCTQQGVDTYIAAAVVNGKTVTNEIPKAKQALGHSYTDNVVWSNNNTEVTASIQCIRCDYRYSTTVQAYRVESSVVEPTCLSDGSAVMKADVILTNADGEQVTLTPQSTITYSALGHNYSGNPVVKWNSDYRSAQIVSTCSRCQENSYDDAKVLTRIGKEPTCGDEGYYEIAALDPDTDAELAAVKGEAIPATGLHTYDYQAKFTWNPDGSVNAAYNCLDCGSEVTEPAEVSVEIIDPTCTKEGAKITTAHFYKADGNGNVLADLSDVRSTVIPVTNHQFSKDAVFNWSADLSSAEASVECENCDTSLSAKALISAEETLAPTCTKTGTVVYTAVAQLNGQEVSDTRTETVPALGHDFSDEAAVTWNSDFTEAEVVSTCSRCDHKSSFNADVENRGAAKEATCVSDGYYEIAALDPNNGEELAVTYDKVIPATNIHTYDYQAEFIWKQDGSVNVRYNCLVCDHEEIEAAKVTEETIDPTCTDEGDKVITAIFHKEDGNGKVLADHKDEKREVIPAAGHNFSDEVVFEWRTDPSAAEAYVECEVCGEKEIEQAVVTDKVTKAATCAEEGVQTFTAAATVNGKEGSDIRTQAIPALDHDYSSDPKVIWNSDFTGAQVVSTCSRCNKESSFDAEIENRGIAKAATCVEAGYYEIAALDPDTGKELAVTYDKVIPATGIHTYDYKAKFIWNQDGTVNVGYNCLVCDYEEIESAKVTEKIIEPSCTEEGAKVITATFHKEDANGKVLADLSEEKREPIPEIGHDFSGEITVTWSDDLTFAEAVIICSRCEGRVSSEGVMSKEVTTPVTCTTDGLETYTAKGVVDGRQFTDSRTKVIAALGHDYSEEAVVTWNADFTEAKVVSTCSRCNDESSFDAKVEDRGIAKAATCVEAGYYEIAALDPDTGKELAVTYDKVIPATGIHTYDYKAKFIWNKDGSVDVSYSCLNCDHEVIEAADVTEKTIDPTCTEEGAKIITASFYKEDADGNVLADLSEEKREVIPEIGHDFSGEIKVNWSDDLTSAEAVVNCSRCEGRVSSEAVISKEVTTPATCTTDGLETYTADGVVDGRQFTDSRTKGISALGHDYSEEAVVTWNSDFTVAKVVSTCSRCEEESSFDAKVEDRGVAKEATCVEAGYYEIAALDPDTGEMLHVNHSKVIPATGVHAYDYKAEFIWNQDGSVDVSYSCLNCDHEVIEAADVTEKTIEPTCTEEGAKIITATFHKEDRNGNILADLSEEKREAIPEIGHDFSGEITVNWSDDLSTAEATINCSRCDGRASSEAEISKEVTTPATCTTDGLETYTAKGVVDGRQFADSRTKVISALSHDYSEEAIVTWNEDFTEAKVVSTCSRCDEESSFDAKVENRGVAKEATCVEAGYYEIAALDPNTGAELAVTHDKVIPTTGIHTYDYDAKFIWNQDGTVKVSYNCLNCDHEEIEAAKVTEETIDPNCTEEGAKIITASFHKEDGNGKVLADLSEEKREAIPEIGHDFTGEITVNWADDLSSAEAVINCSRCDGRASSEAAISKEVTTPATCTTDGLETYTAKGVIDGRQFTDSRTKVISALDHDYSQEAVVTWNEDFTGGKVVTTCSRCDEESSFDAKVEDRGIAKEATCVEAGYYEIAALDPDTGEVLDVTHSKVIPATGVHTYDYKAEFIWNEDGTVNVSYSCLNCDHEVIEAAKVTEETIEPNCTEEGARIITAAFYKEDADGQVLADLSEEKREVIPEIGHDFSGEITVNWSDDLSSAEAVINCSRCDGRVSSEAEISKEVTTPATCTTDGVETYTAKGVIDDRQFTDSRTKTNPALGHDYSDEAVVSWSSDFTKAKIVSTCSRCEEKSSFDAKVEDRGVAKEATCVSDGYYEIVALDPVTDEVLDVTHSKVIPATGIHTYDYQIEFIWNEDGTVNVSYSCLNCDHEVIEAAKVTEETIDPNCTEEGAKIITASFYKEDGNGNVLANLSEEKREVIPAIGHNFSDEVAFNWSADLSSAEASVECVVCGEKNAVQAVVTDRVTTAATCTEEGVQTITAAAQINGKEVTDTRTKAIPALGHDFADEAVVTWNSDFTGAKVISTCSRCDEESSFDAKVEDRGVAKEATCVEAGYYEIAALDPATSEVLDVTYSKVIPATGVHIYDYKARFIWNEDGTVNVSYSCLNCAHEVIEAAKVTEETIDPNCTEEGARIITASFYKEDENGKVLADLSEEKREVIPAVGHNFSEDVVFNWSADLSSAEASVECVVCEEKSAVQAVVTDRVTTAATCTEEGIQTFTAVATVNGKEVTDTRTKAIPALGHDYSEKAVVTWNSDFTGAKVVSSCFRCAEESSFDAKVEDRGIAKEATCVEDGYYEIAALDPATDEVLDVNHSKVIPATGVHIYDYDAEFIWNEDGTVDASYSCLNCDHEVTEPARISTSTSNPSCENDGVRIITATFRKTDEEGNVLVNLTDERREVIPATGHDYAGELIFSLNESTATAVYTCQRCDARHNESAAVERTVVREADCLTDGEVILKASANWENIPVEKEETMALPALDHDYRIELIWDDKNPSAKAHVTCLRCDVEIAEEAEVVEITDERVDPDCTSDGKAVYKAQAAITVGDDKVISGTDTREYVLSKTGHNLVDGSCSICEENFDVFEDVSESNWFYADTMEAYSRGLMSGTNLEEGEFAPYETLTRGQVITVLWRMAGSPQVAFEPVFADVKDGLFFSEPIIWAYQNGITTGYEPNANGSIHFGPSDPVTRQQLSVFMYKFAKDNGKDVSARIVLEEAFPDGKYVSDWARDAMSWMSAEGMIIGVEQNGVRYAAPSMACTRAMMAKLSVAIDDYVFGE